MGTELPSKNILVRWAAYLAYVLLHLALPLYSFVRWCFIPFAVRHFLYFLSTGPDGIDRAKVVQTTRNLGKVPEHLVFVFDERDPKNISSPAALKRISSLICWSLAAGIPYISIFESHGVLKSHGKELIASVEGSPFFKGGLTRVSRKGADEEHMFTLRAEGCQHHRYLQKDSSEGRLFCVKLLSAEDGRQDIVNTIKKLCGDGTKTADINVSSFQKALHGFDGIPDPNLMLKFDGTAVMPDFPPWQMALTEILYVDGKQTLSIPGSFFSNIGFGYPNREVGTIKDVTWPNFLNCLFWYSRSVQRFGK